MEPDNSASPGHASLPEPSSPGLDDTSDSEPVVSAFVACGVAPGPLEPLLAGRRARRPTS